MQFDLHCINHIRRVSIEAKLVWGFEHFFDFFFLFHFITFLYLVFCSFHYFKRLVWFQFAFFCNLVSHELLETINYCSYIDMHVSHVSWHFRFVNSNRFPPIHTNIEWESRSFHFIAIRWLKSSLSWLSRTYFFLSKGKRHFTCIESISHKSKIFRFIFRFTAIFFLSFQFQTQEDEPVFFVCHLLRCRILSGIRPVPHMLMWNL